MALTQQSKLQQYFQSFRNVDNNTVTGVETSQTRQHFGMHREGMERCAVGESKENKPPGSSGSMGAKQHSAEASGRSKSAQRSSKQLFLDLGQKDFSSSKCSICGMVYAKGHEEDEKLHRTFHHSAVQGLKFQGWGQERVVLSDPFTGRLLMILPSDPAAHVKRAQEVCSFVEKAHGITAGWLMSSPQCKVFLFVSLQKRVVGMAVVEPIKQAYRVAAAGPADQEVDSSQSAQPQQQQQSLSVSLHPPQQQQQRPLLWPGLHRSSSSRRPAGSGEGGAASILLSAGGGTVGTNSTGAGYSARADSCPASLLAAAEQMQVDRTDITAASIQQRQQQAASHEPQQLQEELLQQQQMSGVNAGSTYKSDLKGHSAQLDQQDGPSQQQQQQQQDKGMPSTAQRALAAAAISEAFSGTSSISSRLDASGSGGHPLQPAQQDRVLQQQQHGDMPPPPSQLLAAAALSGAFSGASRCNNLGAGRSGGRPTQPAQQDAHLQQQQQQHRDMPPPPPRGLAAAAAALSGAFSSPSCSGNLLGCSSSKSVAVGGSGRAAAEVGLGSSSGKGKDTGSRCMDAALTSPLAGNKETAAKAATINAGASGSGQASKGRSFRAASLSGASGGGSGSSCIMADKRKAVRAMLGVRMVWVSADQRRRGMATKLLDAARCNMVPGYVVPRNQMAFAHPTEEGSRLAASFTGTPQYLLYAIE